MNSGQMRLVLRIRRLKRRKGRTDDGVADPEGPTTSAATNNDFGLIKHVKCLGLVGVLHFSIFALWLALWKNTRIYRFALPFFSKTTCLHFCSKKNIACRSFLVFIFKVFFIYIVLKY